MSRFAVVLVLGVAILSGVSGAARAVDDTLLFDDRLSIIGHSVPEFGGMYVDGDTLVINVTRRTPGIVAALRRAIRVAFPHEDLPRRIRLKDAAFEFNRLRRWHDSAPEVVGIPGVIATDIDERANRLMIGVEHESLRSAVADQLDAAGVPPEAWEVHEMEPPIVTAALYEEFRPLIGGLDIEGGSSCTLGFVAFRGILGFVTNSHCTNRQGGVENTSFYQPTPPFVGPARFVGTETVDPSYFTGGICPAQCGFGVSAGTCSCRFSDSAFIATSGVFSQFQLAFPEIGQRTFTRLMAVVEEGVPVVGLALRKVGKTTGHTVGQVTETCIQIGVPGTRILLKCQTATSIESDLGDSGSPVFRTTSCPGSGSPAPCARLYGVLWGRRVPGGALMSPISNIQRNGELGVLENCTGQRC